MLAKGKTPTQKLLYMVQKCIMSPEGLDVKALPLQDMMYLLFHIRKLSYGPKYEHVVQCPMCGESSTRSHNVPDDFESKDASEDLQRT
ncbi:unnamed protein product, partial [marine sediment metagenome]